MGDVDERDAQLFLQSLQLQLHLAAQLQVQRAEGFVQQQHAGTVHHGAGNGDTLTLPAGKLRRHALAVAGELHKGQRVVHGFFYFVLGTFFQLQTVADVRGHCHVREQGVILEHGVHVAFVGFGVRHVLPVQNDAALVGRFQPGNDAQRRGFAAARRAEQRDEFAFAD